MNYLMLICTDGVSTPEIAATMQEHTPKWVEEMDSRGVRLLGNGLEGRETARTVRVRDGQTLISDGPFADTKEFIGGLDIIEARASMRRSRSPPSTRSPGTSRSRCGRFASTVEVPEGWTYEQLRYLLMPCLDGIPEPRRSRSS